MDLNNDIQKVNANKDINEFHLSKLFSEVQKKNRVIAKSFKENHWKLFHKTSPDRYTFINFNMLDSYAHTINKNLVKVWIIDLLMKYEAKTVSHYYTQLNRFLELSNGFDSNYIEEVNDILISDMSSKVVKNKYNLVRKVLEFLDYTEIKIDPQYYKLLSMAKQQYKYEKANRVLPSSSSILTFSYYLEKFFTENLTTEREMKERIILYYPILLWWKITLIIPMRIGEFCYMGRDCFSKEGKKYYLSFRRNKAGKKKVKFEINEEIFELLQRYVEATKDYGESITLISYKSLKKIKNGVGTARAKNDMRYFNIDNFALCLKNFYTKIIEDKYKIFLDDSEKLRPNDTRHLSFISLMMQGYNPSLIQEIGGHETIERQYEYSYHPEFWVDNEIYQLKKMHSLEILQVENKVGNIENDLEIKAFKKGTSDFKGELEIGYCSDSEQRCESLSSCFFCSHWRIDSTELFNKKAEIMNQMYKKRADISSLVTDYLNMIKELYKINEQSDSFNIDTETKTM